MKLQVENGAILAYRRLPYRAWYAIAEFVDNAVDAYLRDGNRPLLDEAFAAAGEHLTVEVTLDKSERMLRVHDNSMGMSEAELESAMIIGAPPHITAGLSEFGMGMKTAAVWFGDELEIRTKKLGEDAEFRLKFSVSEFVDGRDELEVIRTAKPRDMHYTVIELRGIKRQLGQRAMTNARHFLGSIYREYLRDETLDLQINAEPPILPTGKADTDRFLKRSDGSPYIVEFGPLTVNEKTVNGWIGILRPGKDGFTGRNFAGFSLIRHRRALRGWLDNWRPDVIFGDARNDTLNQRLTGEIYLEGPFVPSHTKDTIDWEGDEEDDLGEQLKAICQEYNLIVEAKKKIRGVDDLDPEAEKERAEANAHLQAELRSKAVQDAITILDVPRPEYARVATEPLREAIADSEPVIHWDLRDRQARLYEVAVSVNDPYFNYEVQANGDLQVIVNVNHPAMSILSSADARIAHYHHVILDALAEWLCRQQNEPFDPTSMRLMKDRLFRGLAEFEEGS